MSDEASGSPVSILRAPAQDAADAWHALAIDQVSDRLRTDAERGLAAEEADRRLAADGPNELRKTEQASVWTIFAGQFASVVIWVLIGAAVVSALLGEMIDGAAILTIVVLNALIGFFQEYRAEQAVAALARMTAPRARVVRAGHAAVIPAAEVVRGDLLLLESGDVVAADARLIEASAFGVNEAPLTGESVPVAKAAGTYDPATPLAERRNTVFLGTSVTSGSGRAIVTATGMSTEVGRIAALLETASSGETPLQRKLDRVGKRLLWACLAIVVVVFVLGLVRDIEPFELFLTAVSLAVAAIPEGLPAVVTIALALGVSRMARRNALVRRLPAIETLGSAQVICTDKTGTLTVGEMTARKIITAESAITVTGEGYSVAGSFSDDGGEATTPAAIVRDVLVAAAGCNDAELSLRDGRAAVVGDPTEGALLVAAAKAGVTRESVESEWPRAAVLPFDSERKRMTIIRRRGDEIRAFVKGAPEVILERCSSIRASGTDRALTEADRAKMLEAAVLLGNDALRVLALAERTLTRLDAAPDAGDVERDLTLLGLIGLQDPPRAEARDAVARCRRAGIRVVMITGDHPGTARAIARELGLLEAQDEVVVGGDLQRMSDGELADRVARIGVYARVTAEHKLRVVRAWKAKGAVVAMTGDGVNDAPALKEASIGVAMGISGTEVTKEAADLVIADDNFASIVAAVEEGRGTYDNIGKTLGYLLGGNAGELAIMLFSILAGWPLPLLPIHLLWINLVTDGLPALALATDPIDPEALRRPPRRAEAELIDRGFVGRLALVGTLTATVALLAFAYEMYADGSVVDARNAAFTAMVIAELLRSFGARSDTRTVWEVGLLSNLRLFAIVSVSVTLQILIHHVPMAEQLFGTQPITLGQCGGWLALGMVPLAVLELRKVIARRRAATGKT
jgi:Ca2+-transporting ATPase